MIDPLDLVIAVQNQQQIEEEAERLSSSLPEFVRAGWPALKPENVYLHNWHIEAVCEYLTAVSKGEILRLQVHVPPVTMKTSLVSILWPAWEWTRKPSLRYWFASYETPFAGRISAQSLTVIRSRWYQERFGDRFKIVRDAEHYFTNDRGGTRLATSPNSTGTGEHGDRIIIDDPVNAQAADATSKVILETANEWYDGTVSSRGTNDEHARVLIMQRLHENDLAGHLLETEEWEVLCLPERYEKNHPYAWERDPRVEGDLLWPERRGEALSDALYRQLRHRAAGQLQQRPAAREGEILLRHWWRFYNPALLADEKRRPRFQSIVQSVDTPLKDKETNDLVAIQAWGVKGADRYLLDLKKGHMNYGQAKRQILEQARYLRSLYRGVAHYCLIENAGYGVELITELKRELTGVTKITRGNDGDKILRAESAASDLEFGNCWLPGIGGGPDETLGPVKTCSADVSDFIENCALFPNALHDDDVDAWSQAMNWLRARPQGRSRTSSPFLRRAKATA